MKLIITRRKKFGAALVPFWIIPDAAQQEYLSGPEHLPENAKLTASGFPVPTVTVDLLDRIGIRIGNGETVTAELPDSVQAVYAATMDGLLSKPAALAGYADGSDETGAAVFRLTLTARGGFARPVTPQFEEGGQK